MLSASHQLQKLDKTYSWHPFTQMSQWEKSSVVMISKAKGNYLYDINGKRYLDAISSLWCNVHGHKHPVIDAHVKKQLQRVSHSTFLGLSHEPGAQLSRELIRIAPKGLRRVFYSDSGSACVEVGLKMAFQYWKHKKQPKKKYFVKLSSAYHGDTLGAVSVGGIDLFHEIFRPLLFKTITLKAPYAYRDPQYRDERQYLERCLERAEKIFKTKHGEIAAIVMEPLMQGAAGMLKHPHGYLRGIKDLCARYNILLVVDEVATGFGRTGKMFACDQEGVTPDILCVAKGLTGGYLPLSATITTEAIYDSFKGRYEEFKAFFHGHTYTANPLACAAALGNLEVFQRGRVLGKLAPLIEKLGFGLERLNTLSHVGQVRQVGLMVGVELVKDKLSKEPYPASWAMGHKVAMLCRERGLMMRPLGNVMVLMPPLSITARQIDFAIEVLEASIKQITDA